MPSFPQLAVGESSDELIIKARPDEAFEIRPFAENDALKFDPPKFYVYPSQNETIFRVTALKEGVFTVRYELVGNGAISFETPRSDTVYTYIKKTIAQAVDLAKSFFKSSCRDKQISSLCGSGLKMTSTCKWADGSNGFVSVENSKIKLPVSITGVSKKNMFTFEQEGSLFTMDQINQYLKTRKIPSLCTSDACPNHVMDANSVDFITNNNLFQRAYYSQFMSLLPSWLRVKVDMNMGYFDADNFQSALAPGRVVQNLKQCSFGSLSSGDTYSLYMPKTTTKFYFLTSSKISRKSYNPLCLAVNMCDNSVHIDLPGDNTLDFSPDFKESNLPGVTLSLKGFGRKSVRKCVPIGSKQMCVDADSYWNIVSSLKTNEASNAILLEGVAHAQFNDVNKVSRRSSLLCRL